MIISPAVVLLSSFVASHSCTVGNSTGHYGSFFHPLNYSQFKLLVRRKKQQRRNINSPLAQSIFDSGYP